MQSRLLKLSMYTSYGKRKKPIYCQGQRSRSLGLYKEFFRFDSCGQGVGRNMQLRLFILSMYTSYGKPIHFQIHGHSSRSLDLYKKFRHLEHCELDTPKIMHSPCSNLVCKLHMEVEETNSRSRSLGL